MFSKLLDKILINKKNLLWSIVGIILFIIFTDNVSAADSGIDFEKTKGTVSTVITWIGTTISVFLALLTYLSTVFLSPEWINGSLFGLSTYFKQIWILVSNVVYLIFAFILIWIAFMNIIGKGGDKYQLKQALPKFIIGILIVPFSWFIIQFILSLSAILTVSALNLPFETFSKFNSALSKTEIPKNCVLNLKSTGENKSEDSSSESSVNKEKDKGFFYCQDEKVKLDEILNSGKSSDSIFGIMATYTYGVLGLENIAKLNAEDLVNVKTMGDLVIKLLFDVLFVIVYSILMIALALVLMVRGIYIWIYIMISPVFGLMYFFDKSSGGGEFFDKFNIKQFISLAFVPVFAMLALTFGLLFMYIVGNGMGGGNPDGIDNVFIKDEGEESKITIGGKEGGDDGFSLSVVGSPANPQNITNFIKNIGGSENGVLGVIGTLIMKIFGIVVLWGAIMAALRSNEITKAIVEPLHSFGTQVGGLVTKAPQYAPIFGGQSMKSMQTIASGVESKISQGSTDRANKFLDKTPFGNNQISKSMGDLRSEVIRANDPAQKASLMQKILKNANGDEKVLYTNPSAQNALFDLVSKINPKILEELSIKKSSDIDTIDKVAKIYEKVEGMGPDYKGILPEDGQKIDIGSIKKAVKDLKDQQISTSTLPNNNQTVNLNIKNGNNGSVPVSLNNIILTDEQKNKINSIDISSIDKKKDIISELKKINGLTDSIIDNIIKAIDPTGSKFK